MVFQQRLIEPSVAVRDTRPTELRHRAGAAGGGHALPLGRVISQARQSSYAPLAICVTDIAPGFSADVEPCGGQVCDH